jgi:hypothetical protein
LYLLGPSSTATEVTVGVTVTNGGSSTVKVRGVTGIIGSMR